MLFGEWDWDTAMKVSREEGIEYGRVEGRVEGGIKMLCDLVVSGLLALTNAVEKSGISQAEFMNCMKQFYPEYELP